MPSKGFLRTLIVAEIVLGIIGVVVPLLAVSSRPESLRAFLEAESEAEMTAGYAVMLAADIAQLILLIVASIGLFFFWRPARILYLITMVVGLLWTLFSAPHAVAGAGVAGWGEAFGETFWEAAVIVSGVILALVYYSPLKDLYEKPKIAV